MIVEKDKNGNRIERKAQQDIPMLFPVVSILNDAKKLFEVVLPNETHKEAFENGLDEGLRLKLDWTPITEVASLNEDTKIWLHGNFCQFLWTFNYVTLVINDCGLILDALKEDKEISKEKATELYDEAKKMFGNALLMFVPKEDNIEEMKAQRGPMFETANPHNNKNKYTAYADTLTISGIAYLLHHEYGHFIHQHDDYTPKFEGEADDHSFKALLNWGHYFTTDGNPLESTLATGAMMALAATAFLHPTFVISNYPDLDDRIENLFNTYRDITGKEMEESAMLFLITGIELWTSATQNHHPIPKENESIKTYLCRLREELILPIKRQVKII